MARYGEHRIEQELRDYQDPPELKRGRWLRRRNPAESQVFRSLVQVNFYPRPKG